MFLTSSTHDFDLISTRSILYQRNQTFAQIETGFSEFQIETGEKDWKEH